MVVGVIASTIIFLLTCLLRGMTNGFKNFLALSTISTHMPLARHDAGDLFVSGAVTFLLTCLLRGMTITLRDGTVLNLISTHMPLARHDSVRV